MDDNGCLIGAALSGRVATLPTLFRVLRVAAPMLMCGLTEEDVLVTVLLGRARFGVGPLLESVDEAKEDWMLCCCVSSSFPESGVGGDGSSSSMFRL